MFFRQLARWLPVIWITPFFWGLLVGEVVVFRKAGMVRNWFRVSFPGWSSPPGTESFLAPALWYWTKYEVLSSFRQDGPYIVQLFQGSSFTTVARTRIITILKQEVRDYVYTFMYPEEHTMTESIAVSCSIGERDSLSNTSGKEELDDNEDEDECQWKFENNSVHFSSVATNAFWCQTIF